MLEADNEIMSKLGEGGLDIFVHSWEWGQRGKGNCSGFPSIVLGMRLGVGSQEQQYRCRFSFNLLFALGGEVLELAKCACCGCGLGQSNKSRGVRNRTICGIHKRFEPWVGVWEATKGVLTIEWHIRLELGEQRKRNYLRAVSLVFFIQVTGFSSHSCAL